MTPASLVFLDDPNARKLAAAWPLLGAGDRSVEAWAVMANVPEYFARSWSTPLRTSGICRDDGTTHPDALRVIAAIQATRFKIGRKKAQP